VLADLLPRSRRTSFIRLESSAFVGRRRELAALGAAVQDARLVTIAGEAGVGKTRLGQRFALAQRGAYEGSGGVWLCELCDARDAEGMSARLARALSIADEALVHGDAAVTAVGRALASRGRALVVLDNVEHLLPRGADVILRWLDLAPAARFVITSREPLGVPGEALVEVGPLGLPDGAGLGGEAAALFVERVRARRPGWIPSLEEASAIGELIRRVRGVPLAVELCASAFAEGRPAARANRGATAAVQAIAWSARCSPSAPCSAAASGSRPRAPWSRCPAARRRGRSPRCWRRSRRRG